MKSVEFLGERIVARDFDGQDDDKQGKGQLALCSNHATKPLRDAGFAR